jgi:DNA-directed RNA polymerase specialized sigma24 family protein
MSSGYLISVDPSEMANRFAAPEVEEEAPEDDVGGVLSSLNYELLDKIPDREADIVYLYFILKKKQADIAEIFGVTQAAISYRLDRGIQRIRFLLSIPQVTEEELRTNLPGVPFKEIDVNILVGMWLTTCQSEVATRLGLTQGRVRHRFFVAVKALEKKALEDPAFMRYHRVFSSIADKNFNILRSVSLPQWQNKGGNGCL